MIQDIEPDVFHNEYRNISPDPEDTALLYRGNRCLIADGDGICFPLVKDLPAAGFRYLFTIDDRRFFLAVEQPAENDRPAPDTERNAPDDDGVLPPLKGFHFESIGSFRRTGPKELAFAAAVGHHLDHWYRTHRFCGACGTPAEHSDRERAMVCPRCGNTVYPTISPAVIVGVIHNGKILMTKYAGRSYKRFALIAGFNEIGETIEQTVHREVMEEVGLPVKNLRYYKSQPWPFSSSLLMGFFCELDGGADKITLDTSELSEGGWYGPEDVPEDTEHASLTAEMMTVFKYNKNF